MSVMNRAVAGSLMIEAVQRKTPGNWDTKTRHGIMNR